MSHWRNNVEVSWARMDELWEFSDDPAALSDRVMEQLKLCLAGKCEHETLVRPKNGVKKKPNRATRSI